MKKARQLTKKDVDISVFAEKAHIPVKGNAMASGDDDFDLKVEKKIQRQLDAGNEWAWCTIVVEVCYGDLTATDSLAGCSYRNKKDFIKNSGYYEDMVESCMQELQIKIDKTVNDFAC